ncbi:methyltransferase-like protein 7B isoform X2 [Phalaenopsis equestris]|uniref:methyltransferase-like protein 7B isoform X2 n=1 Tax=Phalaenopsis equestris TaxID=78828 RepID=UPI0009E2FC0D|nr:methyltransferase-like protein 7B isoform X2 [Phalaenopsis equestris]
MLPSGVACGVAHTPLSEHYLSSRRLTSSKLSQASNLNREPNASAEKHAALLQSLPCTIRCCPCGRRHLLEASVAAAALLPLYVRAGNSLALEAKGSKEKEKFRAARPDWYEELFAKAMEEGMKSYEAEVAGFKTDLFGKFKGTCKKVLELGVGAGPNFKYYAHANDLHVIGVDPNKQMEKYARVAALAVGLQPTSFTFMEGVGEDLPVEDGSMDAVIGTLVLCSVEDVNLTLQEVKRVLKVGGLYLFMEHVAARAVCC